MADARDGRDEMQFVRRKRGKYVKFSASAHEQTWREFREVAEELGYKVQEALTEAMDDWVEKQRTVKK